MTKTTEALRAAIKHISHDTRGNGASVIRLLKAALSELDNSEPVATVQRE